MYQDRKFYVCINGGYMFVAYSNINSRTIFDMIVDIGTHD